MNSILDFLKSNVLVVFGVLLVVIVGLISINDGNQQKTLQATIAAQKTQIAVNSAQISQLTTDNAALRQAINIETGNQQKVDQIIDATHAIAQKQNDIQGQIDNVPVNQTCTPFDDPGLIGRVSIMRSFQQSAYPESASGQ